MIPQFSLERQNRDLEKELRTAINAVIDSGNFILGPRVADFESRFAKYLGVKYAVGVASGTDALSLSLLAIGVGRDDEVILPANAYPTAFAVTAIGAIPKLVDIDKLTFNIDSSLIPHAISKRTKTIIAVHLYGQPGDMEEISAIGEKYKIPIVEDCAQAHGAEIRTTRPTFSDSQKTDSSRFHWKKVGTIGDVGCFSFYPTKNLGCFGDGGMVVTNNKEIYERVKLLRMYGEKERYNSILLGRNSRLDEIQAAILLVKLKYLDRWNERRRKIAVMYNTTIAANLRYRISMTFSGSQETYLTLPYELVGTKHVYHLYVIRTQKRDNLRDYLAKKGVQTGIHYPRPIHLQPSFKFLGYKKGDFPETERACQEILSLPMFPELTEGEVREIAGLVNLYLQTIS